MQCFSGSIAHLRKTEIFTSWTVVSFKIFIGNYHEELFEVLLYAMDNSY